MPLASFNVVLIGDSFPVASLRLSDFAFRHRPFQETLRVGPALQGIVGKHVQLTVIPDRFDLRVAAIDNLDIQIAGVNEVVRAFCDAVGTRTVNARGNNAQMILPDTAAPYFDEIFNNDRIRALLEPARDLTGAATFTFRYGRESRTQLAISTNNEGRTTLDFNFHYELSDDEVVLMAEEDLETCIKSAVELGNRLERSIGRTGVGQ